MVTGKYEDIDLENKSVYAYKRVGENAELVVISNFYEPEVEFELEGNGVTGLENARIVRYGYAVEYNFIPAHQLNLSLETKVIKGLYTAGTINGTSGYEEAACQGFIAGVNASRKILGKKEIIIDRSEGYIGVLIDDIINKKTQNKSSAFFILNLA